MNRIHRLITRPLLFALAAAGMVALFGEPIAPGELADRASGASPGTSSALPTAVGEAPAAQAQEGEHAARLRWLITLPHARNSCCRTPARPS